MNIINLYNETRRQHDLICKNFIEIMGSEWKLKIYYKYVDLRIKVYNTQESIDAMEFILDYDNDRVNIEIHRKGNYKSYEKSIITTLRLVLSDAKNTSHYGLVAIY